MIQSRRKKKVFRFGQPFTSSDDIVNATDGATVVADVELSGSDVDELSRIISSVLAKVLDMCITNAAKSRIKTGRAISDAFSFPKIKMQFKRNHKIKKN